MPPTLKGDQRAKSRQMQISHCRVEKNDRIQKLKKNSDIYIAMKKKSDQILISRSFDFDNRMQKM